MNRPMLTSHMTHTNRTEPEHRSDLRFDRRALFTGGAVGVGLGGALGAIATLGATGSFGRGGVLEALGSGDAAEPTVHPFGEERQSCHGTHQAGITTPQSAHIRFAAYQLRPEVDADALRRMFRVLTEDIEGLTSGDSPLADPEPELAERPAGLTITVGVGHELVQRVDEAKQPSWLGPLPEFSRDQLGAGYDGGDLLVIVQSDDALPLAHAHRMLHRDLVGFADPLWTQNGFHRARGADESGRTMRNMMGQVDGTVNPVPEDEDFDGLVWLGTDAGWLSGGSALVLRRIRMELDTWDRVDRPGREASIGRRLSDGSPLSVAEGEGGEHTPADFSAKDALGFAAIPMASHIRRAHSENSSERIFRRAANYDDGTEAGLLFACYQRDPSTQFVPIQRRLDEADVLNEWVTHVGSAVFAILPGFAEGQTLGHSLFE